MSSWYYLTYSSFRARLNLNSKILRSLLHRCHVCTNESGRSRVSDISISAWHQSWWSAKHRWEFAYLRLACQLFTSWCRSSVLVLLGLLNLAVWSNWSGLQVAHQSLYWRVVESVLLLFVVVAHNFRRLDKIVCAAICLFPLANNTRNILWAQTSWSGASTHTNTWNILWLHHKVLLKNTVQNCLRCSHCCVLGG